MHPSRRNSKIPGRVEAIWIKRARRGPMDSVLEATLVEAQGIVGNADQGLRRQVTLLESEAWQVCMAELGVDRDPSLRRANVLLSGVSLANTRDRVLTIGDVRLVIGGEVTPCKRMEEALAGLQAVMRPDWRGGVFSQVLTGGVIRVGDQVEWETAPALSALSQSTRADNG